MRVSADGVDRRLLQWQIAKLAEIQAFLTTGETSSDGDYWPEAIEGLLNLLASLTPTEA